MQAGLNSRICTRLSAAKAFLNQYFYKLKAYSGYFSGLILAQFIAFVLSLGGTMTDISANYAYHYYNAELIILPTVFWALIVPFLLCTCKSKNQSFALPGNRLSDTLSDIAYLLTGCLFGSVTSTLAGIALRVPVYFGNRGSVFLDGFYPDLDINLTVFATTALYMLFFAAVAYLCGVIIRLHRAFIVILPASIVGAIMLIHNTLYEHDTAFLTWWDSVIRANALQSFARLAIVFSVLFFVAAVLISIRLEVRK
jgi:hypothetical protein